VSDLRERDEIARAVFAGLAPSEQSLVVEPKAGLDRDRAARRVNRGMRATMPFVLAGALTVSMNVTAPLSPASAQPKKSTLPETTGARALATAATASATTVASTTVPATYRVATGDTVSAIASRYGLSTASVLALNGLGWKSLIFPGQVLKLPGTAPAATAPVVDTTNKYTIVKGDTISGIAARFGIATSKVLSANGLSWSSIIYPGQRIVIPQETSGSSAPADEPSIDVEEVVSTTPTEPDSSSESETATETPTATQYFHTVVSGDTISKIAASYGLGTQTVLTANGLSWSSIIYPGQKILIPGKTTTSTAGTAITSLTSEMESNAQIIIDVGRSLGVPDRGIIIALAAAMQESSLRNIDYGDRDSVGLFQQRPSTGWGTVAQLTTPSYAAQLFYGGPSNPNKGKTRGLLDISGWQSMTLTQAAQAVQISAYPDAYAKWEASATAWLAQLG